MNNVLTFSPEVREALDSQRPVVALESTVITHGLPYPENLEVTQRMMDAVRNAGSIPAVLAVYEGRCTIGLTDKQLQNLAQSTDAMKCSLRDLPIACVKKKHGSTTVAATMHLAQLAGIRVFATGGIGGVHRGGEYDVSADLTALGQIPMIVVCSGAKSILDLPATREQLETRGVLVVGWQSHHFPAFYSRESGLETDVEAAHAKEAGVLYQRMLDLHQHSAMLITVPVPKSDEIPPADIDPHIEAALAAAEERGIRGQEITPFLLEKIRTITDNKSMAANIALLVQNASVAGQVAAALETAD